MPWQGTDRQALEEIQGGQCGRQCKAISNIQTASQPVSTGLREANMISIDFFLNYSQQVPQGMATKNESNK